MEKQKGKIKFYNSQKGFGFIIPEGGNAKDMFFHKSGIVDGYHPREGEAVEYDTYEGKKGIEAVDVQLA